MLSFMEDLLEDLAGFGGAATTAQLYALGHSPRKLRNAVELGIASRIKRSWIVSPGANPSIATALEHGGVLAGASALRSYGIWVSRTGPVVVGIPRNRHVPRMAVGVEHIGGRFDVNPMSPWRVSVLDALEQFVRRASRYDAVASLDSALNQKLIGAGDLDTLEQRLPIRCRAWITLVDGSADSGLETFGRLGCIDNGWPVEVQAPIPGGGLADLRIYDWLYTEFDGAEFHDDPEQARRDRERNNRIVRAGGRWHRFSYADIMHRFDESMNTLRILLRQGPNGPVGVYKPL